jgi:hypothetical protein
MTHATRSRSPISSTLLAALLAILLPTSSLKARNKTDAAAGAVRPSTIDLRPGFAELGLAARVQGKRGTCSVFAVTQAMEFAFGKLGNKVERLSPEFLNWASNKATNDADDGSFFSDLWKGYEAYGISLESALPYREAFDPKLEPAPETRKDAESRRGAGLRLHWIKEWDPKRGLSDEELGRVLDTLAQGWPVCGGFLWPKKAVWAGGVLGMCPRDQVFDGHSLLLVGYRDDPKQPGGGVLLIRNSGGDDRDGFVTYEYAKAYMNDAIWIDRGD